MKNKYYTPELEEFHIGFEYEVLMVLDQDTWDNTKISKEGFNQNFDRILNHPEQCRVKYLDKEDIESFGFRRNGRSIDDWYYLNKTVERALSAHRDYSISIQHDFDTNQGIVIRGFEWEDLKGTEETLYRGTCKNKSEFKKLMKQLNIC